MYALWLFTCSVSPVRLIVYMYVVEGINHMCVYEDPELIYFQKDKVTDLYKCV